MATGLSRNQIQICRAFGIILVALHHAINNMSIVAGGWLLEVAHSNVIFFFFISGYLYEKNKEKYYQDCIEFCKKKTKQLIIPYLFWTLILYFAVNSVHLFFGQNIGGLLNNLGFPKTSIKEVVLNTVFFQDFYVEYLWYLYVLFLYFLSSIILRNIDKYIINKWFVLCCLVVVSYAVYINEMPYILGKIVRYLPDYLIGRLLFHVFTSEKRGNHHRKNICFAIGGILFAIAFFGRIRLMMPKTILRASIVILVQDALYWSIVILGIEISRFLDNNRIGKCLLLIGNYSFDIYLMHSPYIVPVVAMFLSKLHMNVIIVGIMSVSLGIIIPIVVSKYIIRKNMLLSRVMLGR